MPEVERITAGIDWLSCSMPNTAPEYHEWRASCHKALEGIAKGGYKLEYRRLLGYEGLSAGNCFIGENEVGSFCQITGERANDWFDAVYHRDCKVSRIDAQITVKLTTMNPNVAKEAYRNATLENKTLPASRRRKLWIIVGSDGGDTFYLGSPTSEQRARVYNKEVQSEDIQFTRCWRYEVVFRNELSKQYATSYRQEGISRPKFILQSVSKWFRVRGVDIYGLPGFNGVILPIERTRPTDIEAKLRWVDTQVRPTIAYLIAEGYRDTLMALLFPEEQ